MAPISLLSVLTLLGAALAAPTVVIDEPHISLPLNKRHTNVGSAYNVLEHDRARIQAFKDKYAKEPSLTKRNAAVTATNVPTYYSLPVEVGDQTFDLIVDTGSSNTWVGAGTKYKASSTSTKTKYKVEVEYGSGEFSGTEYTDTVNLGSGLTITKQSIGVASSSEGFEGTDGIVGIGPLILTEGTLTNDEDATIPTVTNNLYSQGVISSELIGIYFAPSTEEDEANGELDFGAVDTSKITTSVTYTPITATEPASYYWGIDQSITLAGETILTSTAGIVDTGTTLLYIAENAYNDYVSVTGATVDENTGLLTVASESDLQSLYFEIGGASFEFTANAQIWPRSLNTLIGGEADTIYLIVASTGDDEGTGLDFINGYVFLERFYSVFDTTNSQVGFAETANTYATTN